MPRIEKWEWTFLKVVGAVCVIYAAFLAWGWYKFGGFPPRPTKRDVDLRWVSKRLGLGFPASARLKRSLIIADFLVGYGWAEVEIAPQDAELFRKTASQDGKYGSFEQTRRGIAFAADFRMARITPADGKRRGVEPPAWWHPDGTRGGMGGRGGLDYDGFLEVLISPQNARPTIVYLQWTEG